MSTRKAVNDNVSKFISTDYKIGIDVIGFYTPNYYLDLKHLAEARSIDVNKFYIGLGQKKMSVLSPDEDIVTMGAEAALRALQYIDTSDINLLIFATESGIDQSKSAGIFVHKLLNLPINCRVIELKQACYSATIGLQLAMSMLQTGSANKVLLIAADVARYGFNSAGEPSQGGGAIAMVLSQNPRMITIEPESGYCTEDVMDFWRPNYRNEPIVDGKYSCEIYLRLLQKTWQQYFLVSGRLFNEHQYFCYHTPIIRLVERAHQHLLSINKLPKLADTDLKEKLGNILKYNSIVGNCYTASLYISLISLLENTTENLTNSRIGFYSYGSGCTAEFFSGIIQSTYKTISEQNYNQSMLEMRKSLSALEYEDFYNFTYVTDGSYITIPKYKNSRYRLAAIENHKRIYEVIC